MFPTLEDMQKYVKILLGVFITIALVEALLFFDVLTPIRSCKPTEAFNKTFAGCGFRYGQGPFEGYIVAFKVRGIRNEGKNTFITVNFPVLSRLITLPMTFNVGKVITGKDLLKDQATQVAVCRIMGGVLETAHDCKFIKVKELSSVIKPGSFIAAHFMLDERLFLKDPYFQKCQTPHKVFLGNLYKKRSLFSYLPYLSRTTCAPTIGQIFYR